MSLSERIGRAAARVLSTESGRYERFAPMDVDRIRRILRPCDVILIDGGERLSMGIKYLTQSTWSHAALYVGDRLGRGDASGEPLDLIESLLVEGTIASPLSKYSRHNVRICRPVGLPLASASRIMDFMISRIGLEYDVGHVIDLARWLLPFPFLSRRRARERLVRGRRRGSGRGICSSLIAQAFQAEGYPLLPDVSRSASGGFEEGETRRIRHAALYVPRDFDLSPYFRVVKPTLELGFDYAASSDSEGTES